MRPENREDSHPDVDRNRRRQPIARRGLARQPRRARAAALRVDAAGGLALTVLEQRFTNAFDEPLRLRYALPLPADGAVSGFRFRIGDRTVTGEVRSREAARTRYEEALVEGRTASLVEEERANVFTQELGDARAEAFEATLAQRRLEAAAHPAGLSTTARAVLARLVAR